MDKNLALLLSDQDGQFNEELSAYVSAYVSGDDEFSVELEFVDRFNEDEVIEVKRFTLTVVEVD